MPAALAISRPVQCVASPGGPANVISTTRSTVAAGSGFLRPGRVASCSSPSTPLGRKPGLPTPDRRLALAGLTLDRHGAEPISAQQHDLSPPHMLLPAIPRSDHRCQPFAVARTKPDFNAFSHP